MSESIILGGVTYPVAPLTLGQLRIASPAFYNMTTLTPQGVAAMISVVGEGIKAANPEFNTTSIDSLRGVTVPELWAATRVIGALMGFEPIAAPSGEATGTAETATVAP